ncbi:hemolysin family protein [Ammoniphilus resinae]|uniref:hemolysin family protein n=1 Tax=Ammoniphilus resinae TaxID=861532 RepID=UPI001FD8489F|nr:hemolysin family protein [Ammoniphilus resinae]
MFNLFLVILLVLLNGFFVAAEFAMVKVRSSRLESLVLEGNQKAKYAQKLTSNLDAYLSACQLGITLASLGLGWVGEPAIAKAIEPVMQNFGFSDVVIHTVSFIIAFSIITFLHIVLGELAPKSMAIQKSEGVTMWTAPLLIVFHKIMYPFIWFLNGTANWFLRLIGIQPATEHEAAHTEEEIRILMEESHKSGYIDNTELALVDNIFDFSERNAREVMIPRTDMVCLYAEHSFEDNLEIALKEQMTRYPVCNPDKDNIIGFIHIKDLFAAITKGKKNFKELIRPVIRVPESMQISALLKQMQKKKAQLAIVIDEYGGTAGLLTIEDIIEEIVGEIQDEFDEERQSIETLGNNSYSVDGRLILEEANDFFGFKIGNEDVDTIGGWVYSQVETPPKVNQRVEFDGFEFIISEVDNFRINRILIKRLKTSESTQGNYIESAPAIH